MTRALNDVVVVDAVRTAFGRAGEKGIFWKTRAEDLCVPLLKALIERNPAVKPDMIEDSIWGVTNQVKEQGGTIGRMLPILAEWGWEIPGCSIDRMCASGLTAIGFSVSHIEVELADGSRIIADKDQQPRPGTSMEGLAGLKTPFREEGGRVTAGNASGLNDGAAAVLLMSRSKADELGLQPKMRWVASAVAAVDPTIMANHHGDCPGSGHGKGAQKSRTDNG